jgi:hypothetical protein
MMHHCYVSTACQHGRHEECRNRCKFCSVGCLCLCHGVSGSVNLKLDEVLTRLRAIKAQEKIEMANVKDVQGKLDALKTSIEGETDLVTSVKTLVTGQNDLLVSLRQQLADAIAANDPEAMQAVVDTLDALTTTNAKNAQDLADAVVANTPAA